MDDTRFVRGPVVLIVRDGWGHNPHPGHHRYNAVELARTPVADELDRRWPRTMIHTSGEDVGLPVGIMGNSEVGHQNIGAGRVVDQELMRITRSVRDGSFLENAALRQAFEHAADRQGAVHLIGLVSDGRVHSDLEHLFSLIDLAERLSFPGKRLFVHAITDGRDTAPTIGLGFVEQVEQRLRGVGGRIATVMGRYYAMDRDHRWDRVAMAYAALTGRVSSLEQELPTADGAAAAIRRYYDHPTEPSRRGDEFIVPCRIVDESGGPLAEVDDGDAVIFFNFRGDRPRELSKAFTLPDAAWSAVPGGGFDRGTAVEDLFYCGMTRYETGLPLSAVAFDKPPKMADILGRVVADRGLTQLRCAETEKYPHVTYFFNDYREDAFEGERRMLVPSPKEVSTYDQKPQMSAEGVCEAVLDRLGAEDCEPLIVVNFANPDMVGHTGNLEAVIEAVQVVDAMVGRIVEATLARGGALIITADHGNAEQMWDQEHDCPHTAHTTYDVPLYVVGVDGVAALREGGRLADIAPTVLQLMGIDQPEAMTGASLLIVAAPGESECASEGRYGALK